jgi:hypothetical protein
MAFLLDDKKNLGKYVIPMGGTQIVTSYNPTQIKTTFMIGDNDAVKYTFPTIRSPNANYILKDVTGNGILTWEPDGGSGSSIMSFKKITDSGTNYDLLLDDHMVEIVSDTYNTVTLPNAIGLGGKEYIISRESNNNSLILVAPFGNNIDDRQSTGFWRKHTRINVVSNDTTSWYVL